MTIVLDFWVLFVTLVIIGVGFLQHVKVTRYPYLSDRVQAFAKPEAYLLITEENLHGRTLVVVLQMFYFVAMCIIFLGLLK
ncbi:hypothetical protein PBI_SCTP2_490 [Salicola phage SCTP-2]|nr:hypothetical protein PBI_SCTP2_490 [Salicola phage SCTP-2]